jgi:hypothetical protein
MMRWQKRGAFRGRAANQIGINPPNCWSRDGV